MANEEPIVISFYTDEYSAHAERMIEDCKRLGLHFYVEKKESTQDFTKNTALKPFFIRACLNRFQRPVLWVDVDGLLQKTPNLVGLHTDFAACKQDNNQSIFSEWSVGLLWFNYTLNALDLLDEWCHRSTDVLDRKSFNDACNHMRGQAIPCVLPEQYNFLDWKDSVEVPSDTIFCDRQLNKSL